MNTCSRCGLRIQKAYDFILHQDECRGAKKRSESHAEARERLRQDMEAKSLRKLSAAFPCGCVGFHGWDCLEWEISNEWSQDKDVV